MKKKIKSLYEKITADKKRKKNIEKEYQNILFSELLITMGKYEININYDHNTKLFHGEVIGIKDAITFQGTTFEELEQAFKNSVEDYLDWCKEKEALRELKAIKIKTKDVKFSCDEIYK